MDTDAPHSAVPALTRLARLARAAAPVSALLYLCAVAANQGFVRAFDVPRATLLGIDHGLIFDPTIVFAVFLGGLLVTIPLTALASARLLWISHDLAGRLPRLHGLRRLLFVAAGTIGLVGTVRVAIATVPRTEPLLTTALLAVGAAVTSPRGRAQVTRLRMAATRFPAALAAAGLLLGVVASYEMGNGWGEEVRTGERVREPLLAVVLLAHWPHAVILAAPGSDPRIPAPPGCATEIQVGERNGRLVLYNVTIDRVHDVPASLPHTRTSLREIRRSGCPGPAAPASAR